ncbi:MAG: Abortive infection protein [Thermoleophilia bacterium]|nr:Abortive infection protein [Thermoleophilia bacterium]
MPLPAHASMEVPRGLPGWRGLLDVAGGVAFATLIGLICTRAGSLFFTGGGWIPVITWESVWLVAAILCAPLMPSAIDHDISWRSTLEGLKLDWPELVYATWILGIYTAHLGMIRLDAGPIALSLSVGVAEEFIFRVLLLGWLVGRVSAPAALTISSVVFGVAHLNEFSVLGLASVIPQTAGGFVLGAVYLRTRNPIAPILAHAYWDFPYFMVIGMGVTGGSTERGMPTVLDIAPWLAFIVYGLWLVRHGVATAGRADSVVR